MVMVSIALVMRPQASYL